VPKSTGIPIVRAPSVFLVISALMVLSTHETSLVTGCGCSCCACCVCSVFMLVGLLMSADTGRPGAIEPQAPSVRAPALP